jgi:hypothetical protein
MPYLLADLRQLLLGWRRAFLEYLAKDMVEPSLILSRALMCAALLYLVWLWFGLPSLRVVLVP